MPFDDDGRTRVRAALPRFLLRGVSGATFGKTFAVTDNAVIGRQPDCDIPVPAEEISRHHARLKVTPDGVHVEDMGSANGTYINGKRVEKGVLKPGEELRLDTVRFLLVTPGMDAKQQSAGARVEPAATPAPAATKSSSTLWVVIGVIAVALVVFVALHYAGVV
jgi:pSer/pThr/pTyr-binding forkhead associated (FHA) protein